ncbi:hypothetical protein VTN31DRAFT_696 [Thermomyces dupontii]|uniref:uncharacterized protein n=1 Tax=Talaromyces thermophilus TaxID=28565 RepID=UPI003744AA88
MTDPDSSYRPRSPDFSSFHSATSPYRSQPPFLASPLGQRASYDASPFFSTPYHSPHTTNSRIPQHYVQQTQHQSHDDMSRRSARLSAAAAAAQQQAPMQRLQADPQQQVAPMPAAAQAEEPRKPRLWDGVEVKTKFPVARIKRIMQADEDVGKVAQVTPIAVSKALELFMISLVLKAAKEARDRNSKRITAAHLKQAVAKDEVLDFLADIIAKVPDNPKKNDEDGSDHNEGKRRTGGRRRKDESS